MEVPRYSQFAAHVNTVAANEALVLDAAERFPALIASTGRT